MLRIEQRYTRLDIQSVIVGLRRGWPLTESGEGILRLLVVMYWMAMVGYVDWFALEDAA